MTTKREIIAQGLEEIGLAEYDFDASPEEVDSFLRRLDRMAAQWDGVGVRAGYNFAGGLDDDAGIPDTVVDSFAQNLAIRMAPSFGKAVSQDTKANAAMAYHAMLTTLAHRPQTPYPAQMPIGTGNKRGVLDRQYFGPNTGEVPDLNEGATDY